MNQTINKSAVHLLSDLSLINQEQTPLQVFTNYGENVNRGRFDWIVY